MGRGGKSNTEGKAEKTGVQKGGGDGTNWRIKPDGYTNKWEKGSKSPKSLFPPVHGGKTGGNGNRKGK